MALTRDQVIHIAKLARLELTSAEIEQMTQQLSDILAAAARLNELNTDAIPPTASVLPLQNVWRADEVTPSLSAAEALANAPDTDETGAFFRVQAILE